MSNAKASGELNEGCASRALCLDQLNVTDVELALMVGHAAPHLSVSYGI
jgi:hypothetical protein